MKINNKDLLSIGAYRPPKVTGKALEGELNSLFMWAEMQKQTLGLMGDLNLNRLDTNKREGKILKDLEDGFGLECLIKKTHSNNKLIIHPGRCHTYEWACLS